MWIIYKGTRIQNERNKSTTTSKKFTRKLWYFFEWILQATLFRSPIQIEVEGFVNFKHAVQGSCNVRDRPAHPVFQLQTFVSPRRKPRRPFLLILTFCVINFVWVQGNENISYHTLNKCFCYINMTYFTGYINIYFYTKSRICTFSFWIYFNASKRTY